VKLFLGGLTAAALVFSAGAYARSNSGADENAKQPNAPVAVAQAAVPETEKDQTLRAMHDEMERSRTRLKIEGVDKPYYVEYRLLDFDFKTISSSFGSLVNSNTSRNRAMSIDVRIGDYHLDSSNFITDEGFQGFLGTTGSVGIDRDYHSLRQDLWLSTDQAYKQAATQMSLKQAFLRSLTKPPEIDDFSQTTPLVQIDPRIEDNWTTRNWEDEARASSAALKNYPELSGVRVNYYMAYITYYLMNTEGTTIRTSRTIGAVEAAMDAQADDGMPVHNFYSVYVASPQDMPTPDVLSKSIAKAAEELIALRKAPNTPDYTGPVLFDAPAAGSLLAQALSPSLSGERPPLSMLPAYDEMMERMGGRSEWSGRVNTRVLPASVSLVDDPTMKEFNGTPLQGSYQIDDEGVKAQKVTIVQNGVLKDELMSRRPGPDFQASNGHARSALLSDTKALPSNLIFSSSSGLNAADMKKKFLDACKDDGHEWCLEVRKMDNPALSSLRQEDFNELIGSLAGGISSGLRMPLMVYRVYVSDGHEELVRGAHIEGLQMRTLRNIPAIGDDPAVFSYMQNPAGGFAGTAFGAFGSAQGGIPSTVIAPSLLLDEVEIRGFHGEPRRLPLVEAPPLK
jgi:predicted Zn-dependent protease